MTHKIVTSIALAIGLFTGNAMAHGDIELGPNKGRILEFSTNETMHGEVTEADGKVEIAVLDKDMKLVEVKDQELNATAGTREKPAVLAVEKTKDGFVIPAPKAGEWIIFQFKLDGSAKPITARLHYNTTVCDPCKQPEWRCACEKK